MVSNLNTLVFNTNQLKWHYVKELMCQNWKEISHQVADGIRKRRRLEFLLEQIQWSPTWLCQLGEDMTTVFRQGFSLLHWWRDSRISIKEKKSGWPLSIQTLEDVEDVESINYAHEALEKSATEVIMDQIRHIGRDNARTPMQWNDEAEAGVKSTWTSFPSSSNFGYWKLFVCLWPRPFFIWQVDLWCCWCDNFSFWEGLCERLFLLTSPFQGLRMPFHWKGIGDLHLLLLALFPAAIAS